MVDYCVKQQAGLQGDIQLPGDKSISHRAILLASIAEGQSHIQGLSDGLDVRHTLECMQQLGVKIEGTIANGLTVSGVGLQGLQQPAHSLECGNSGTTMRLLLGLLSGCDFTSHLSGDASLSRRPMQRVIDPLTLMGAQFASEYGHAPLAVVGKNPLTAFTYQIPVASAQVKSALILAALNATGMTIIDEPTATRDHTERMLKHFGYPVICEGQRICIEGGHQLHARELNIPKDLSAAAFFIVAATICPNSEIRIQEVTLNPGRMGFLQILQQMGADITFLNPKMQAQEPVADLVVKSAKLTGITIDAHWVASTIDEFPILMVAAAHAEGQTRIQGAAELRVKESDRIATMATGLRNIGVVVEEFADGAVIQGGKILGGEVDSRGDHRVAMAFCMAGSSSESPILVKNCDNIATSFPDFFATAHNSGMGILEHSW